MEPPFIIIFETKSLKSEKNLDVCSDEFYMYVKKVKYYVFWSM
jgi:hypothetical protein